MALITPREALATTLLKAAETRGTTTSELSRETHIPRETLRRKLAGAQEFTVSELDAIAEVLDLDIAALVNTYAAARAAA